MGRCLIRWWCGKGFWQFQSINKGSPPSIHITREFPTIDSQLVEPKVDLADDSFSHLGKSLKQRLKGLVLGGSLSFSKKKLASNYRVILTLTSGSLKSNNCQKNLPWTAGSLNLRKKPRTDGYVIPNLNIKKTWNPVSFKLWKLKFRKPGTLGSLILIFFQKAGTSSYNKSKNCPMMNRHQSGYESRVTAKVNSSLLYEEDLVLALKNKLEWFQFHFWFWNSDLVLVWFLQNPNQNWRLIVA